jgi:hypothetical protein
VIGHFRILYWMLDAVGCARRMLRNSQAAWFECCDPCRLIVGG